MKLLENFKIFVLHFLGHKFQISIPTICLVICTELNGEFLFLNCDMFEVTFFMVLSNIFIQMFISVKKSKKCVLVIIPEICELKFSKKLHFTILYSWFLLIIMIIIDVYFLKMFWFISMRKNVCIAVLLHMEKWKAFLEHTQWGDCGLIMWFYSFYVTRFPSMIYCNWYSIM